MTKFNSKAMSMLSQNDLILKNVRISPLQNMETVQRALIEITPELAASMLPDNYQYNRTFRLALATKYARAQKRSDWIYNGVSIKYALVVLEDGTTTLKLIDGQHRLHAITLSGIPMLCDVIWNLPASVIGTIDVGRKRGPGDNLRMVHHIGNYHNVAAALSILWQYLNGRYTHRREFPSEKEIADLYVYHQEIEESVRVVGKQGQHLGITPSLASFLHYVTTKDDPDSAEIFIDKLLKGVDLTATDPVFQLRKTLEIQQDIMKKGGTRKGHKRMWLRLMLAKAWNYHQAGRTLKVRMTLGPKEKPEIRMPEALKAESERLKSEY